MKETFVFTQARLNSQRLPNKMIRAFAGSSLWEIACKKLHELPLPKEQKWVGAHEKELIDIALQYDIIVYKRGWDSANEDTDVAKIWEICGVAPFSHYVLFNACLPLLRVSTILDFYYEFQVHSRGLFAVKPLKDYVWSHDGELIHPPGTKMLNTKEFDVYPERQLFLAAHALYGGTCQNIINGIQLGSFTQGDPALFPVSSKIELFDVDDEEDFKIAEAVYEKISRTIWN